MRGTVTLLSCAALLAACGDDGGESGDAITLEHCEFVPVAPTANATGTVTAGPLVAGAAEQILEVPVGTSMGGFTGRANSVGDASDIDGRDRTISGGFNPSVGVESAPRAKALALSSSGETVVIVKIDAIFVYEGMLFDLEARLGDGFHGKVILAASHSHSAPMQFTGHSALKAGGGDFRELVYGKFLDGVVAAANAALEARQPARIGFFVDTGFDVDEQINRDRRGENDALPGGDRGDEHLVLIRVDALDGTPIAVVPIFGEHGTLMDQDSPIFSNDAPGGIERVLEEQLAGAPVVLHLQSAGADTSPVGHGNLDCGQAPGDPEDPCLPFLAIEGHGRNAAPTLLAAWTAAGAAMETDVALEMLTRSVELGPDPETFTIRDGALAYAPFDLSREADGVVYDGAGELVSPIDEFNAPVGAALCEGDFAMFSAGAMPGTEGILTYGGCNRLDVAADVLGALLDIELEVTANRPICQMTRTTISSLRIGDYLIGTMPGELSVLIADLVRDSSPVDAEHTIVVGYAQGHVGYLLRPEDWVLSGYEPSITFWGPLEAEYLAERLAELMPLAMTPERDDAAAGGADRVATPSVTDDFPIDDPAPMAGSVPATLAPDIWLRSGLPASAQPADQVERVSGLATFVWYGDDPAAKMPVVTLEHDSGGFAPVRRQSGRIVRDGDFLISYTPLPLNRADGEQQHVWAVEWQPVPWLGAAGLDDLGDRAGVPLGTYRFHVEGDGWALDSEPFEVVPGGTRASATRAGTQITVTSTLLAPRGYRLLDLSVASNGPVPYRTQDVTVELLAAGDVVLDSRAVTTDGNGVVSFDDADVATAVTVRVTDSFGNVATATL